MSTPRRSALADLARRVAKLEDSVLGAPLICAHPRGVPGRHLPEHDIDGTPLPWEQRAMRVVYAGRPARPLRPGELEALQRRFGSRLRMPFLPRIADATRRPLGEHRYRDGDDGDE